MANIGIDILGLPTTVGGLTGQEWLPVVQGGTTKRTQSVNMGLAAITQLFPAGIDYVTGVLGATLSTGVQGTGLVVPFNCTINQAVVNGDVNSGSVVVDIWRATETQYDGGATHPVAGDSICGGNFPTITNASKFSDSILSGWTKSLNQGDVLWYNIQSVASFHTITIALKVSRVLP